MIVHFPIALLLMGFLFATVAIFCKKSCNSGVCMQKTAFWLLTFGALGAAGAVVSGFIFTSMQGPIFEQHRALALSTMVVSIFATALYALYSYKKPNKSLLIGGYLLYAVAVALVSYTGHLGGIMVYMF
ncbi:hypothetical protein BN938_1664 [Mucinivorans hirudinis]|uniref:DUF2231 domain-containing protein n=1 Tax=Mucinivorans hirudinis TaxID=1433126 RepID=A0A060RDE9_9BACT|nr:hypothetical protein BN938_1664 [Mucinivorans hirudinis]